MASGAQCFYPFFVYPNNNVYPNKYDAKRILTAVLQSDWKRPVGRPHISWLDTMNYDLSCHNLSVEDAVELALDKPLWRLLAACGVTH